MADVNNHLAKQEAIRLASEAIAHAGAAYSQSKVVRRPVCLVTSYKPRSDLPEGALLVGMTANVVERLAAMGLTEPVSMTILTGMWWAADVDMSSENPMFEPGGAFTRVVTSSEKLVCHYSFSYCEVTDGPFERREDVPRQ